jgi:exopolysaccharide biosynthesis WecB/TagA/CpsF family protein
MLTCPEQLVQPNPADSRETAPWPRKLDVFGVGITPTTYAQASQVIVESARLGQRGLVSCYAVHALVTFCSDPQLRDVANRFDMITPDGQPVRWALNLLHGAGLTDRVYGPQLTLELCQRAAEEQVSVYLYGGSPQVVAVLQENLRRKFPKLVIAGYESPPYRPLTPKEHREVVDRINDSGAGLVFIGLGCPKQDLFAFKHRDDINAVQVCVGAAFDFHAGVKSIAPEWMQRRGLEWLFRLIQEPKRLWQRFLVTNSSYLVRLLLSALNVPKVMRQRAARRQPPAST